VFIKDIPYEDKSTPTQLSGAIKWLQDNHTKLLSDDYTALGPNAQAALFNGKSKYVGSGPCHGFMSGFNGTTGNIPDKALGSTLLAASIQPPNRCNVRVYTGQLSDCKIGYDQEATDAWEHFWFTESELSRFVVSHQTRIGVVLGTNTPNNLLLMLCILTRHVREKHAMVRGWHWLVTKYGVNPYVAYLLAFNGGLWPEPVAKAGPIESQMGRSVYMAGGGHYIFDGNETISHAKNFVRQFAPSVNPAYNSGRGTYSGISKTFGESCYGVRKRWFVDVKELIDSLRAGNVVSKPELKMPFGNYHVKPDTSGRPTLSSADIIKYLPDIQSLFGV
jgi:hypothetical protein